MHIRLTRFIPAALVVAALILPAAARAAALSPLPRESTVAVGRTFPMTLSLDSQGQIINVVSATLHYPADLLEAVQVSTGGSFLSLWPDPPKVDAAAGTVAFSGGVPHGVMAENSQVLTVIFRALARGSASVTLLPDSAQVLLNDGFGTPATVTAGEAAVQITNPASLAPSIVSPSHPDEATWSRQNNFTARWTAHPTSFYSYSLSRDPSEQPDDIVDTTGDSAAFPNLSDGVWYFTLKEKVGDDPWGPVAAYRVMVDLTAPDPVTAELVRDPASDVWLMSFNAVDRTSGVARYEILERRPKLGWFPFALSGTWQNTANPYRIVNQKLTSEFELRVTDFAGNVRVFKLIPPQLSQARTDMIVGLAVTAAVVILIALLLRQQASRRKKREYTYHNNHAS